MDINKTFKKRPVRVLTGQLRELLDIITNQALHDTNPGKWANAYVALEKLIEHEGAAVLNKSVLHNLGKQREEHLRFYYDQIRNA